MDKPTARQRSCFGAFQLGATHLKSNIAKVVPRPKAYDMAEMRREGKTLEEVGEALGLSPSTVRTRLTQAGFTSAGVVRKAKK